jgi:hypothetical protein
MVCQKNQDHQEPLETVIGQFVERFNIQEIRGKDFWHLAVKIGKKILDHTMAFFVNLTQNTGNPLTITGLSQTLKTCTQLKVLYFRLGYSKCGVK